MSLRGKQSELYYKMMGAVGGSNLLMAYYYKFIFKNLKNIIKGKILKKSIDEIKSTVTLRAEELIQRRDITIKVLSANTIEEVIANLKPYGFGNEIEKACLMYKDTKEIGIIDTYLDKILYQNLADSIKSNADLNLLKLFGTELDVYNLTNIVRAKFWNMDSQMIKELLVSHTASTSDDLLSKMIDAENIKMAFMELSKTKFVDIIPTEGNDIFMINEFETKLNIFLYNSLLKEFTNMFKLSTVISVVRLYDYEIQNLASISYAVENNIPTETTMAKIIVSGQ
jgi:V/A-type H+-transporting ATPase subunit C